MKKLLVCVAIVLNPILLYAQSLSIGGLIGLNPKTTKSYVPDNQTTVFGGRICLSYSSIEIGLEDELAHYQVSAVVLNVNESHTVKYPKHKVYATGFYNAAQIFGNYKLTDNQLFDYYIGLCIGYNYGLGSRYIVLINQDENSRPVNKRTLSFGCHGICIGIQTGVKLKVTKWLNLQGQLAARGAFLKEAGVSYVPVYFPLTIGANVKLF